MKVQALFIPETEEMQNDINAILSQPNVEYVDMKLVPPSQIVNTEYDKGGVWLIVRVPEGSKPLV